MITPENISRHELMGLQVELEASKSKSAVGLKGRVVDETRQTLVIETGGQDKTVAKSECVFIFTIPSGERVRVSGSLLVARPEDRIKKKLHGRIPTYL